MPVFVTTLLRLNNQHQLINLLFVGNKALRVLSVESCNYTQMYLQVCMTLSKKKAVHILSVTEDKIIPLKEIPLPETPLHMVRV